MATLRLTEEVIYSDPSIYSDMESSSSSPGITTDDSDNEYPPLNILNKPLQRSKRRKIKSYHDPSPIHPNRFYSPFEGIFNEQKHLSSTIHNAPYPTAIGIQCNILPLKPAPSVYPHKNASNHNNSKQSKHIQIITISDDDSDSQSSSSDGSESSSCHSSDGSDSDYVPPALSNATNHNYIPQKQTMMVDPSKTVFKCTECFFQTDSGAAFKAHSLQSHQITDPFLCSQCGKTFVTKGNLNTHKRRIHDKEINYHCEWCPKGFFEKSQYKLHCARVHRKRVLTQDVTTEEVMKYETQSNTSGGGGGFKCNDCGQCFAKKFYLKNHVINIHMDNRDKPYQCRYCTYGAAKRWQVMCHENAHRNERAFKCELCEKAFNNKKGLKNHKDNIHLRPFKCVQCGNGFGTKQYLEGHMLSKHTKNEDKPYQCRYCEHGTSTLRNMRTHELTHCKEKPYKCKECGKAFKGERNLETHQKTVHIEDKDKEYECKVCHKRYALKSRLKTHVLSHSTHKPFKCDQCDYATPIEYRLKKHVKTHSDEKPFECDICFRKFRLAWYIKSHKRNVHHIT